MARYFISNFSTTIVSDRLLISTSRGLTKAPSALNPIFCILLSLRGTVCDVLELLSDSFTDSEIDQTQREKVLNMLLSSYVILPLRDQAQRLSTRIFTDDSDEANVLLENALTSTIGDDALNHQNQIKLRLVYAEKYPDNPKPAFFSNEGNELVFSAYYIGKKFVVNAPQCHGFGFPCHHCNVKNLMASFHRHHQALDFFDHSDCKQFINLQSLPLSSIQRSASIFFFAKRVREILLNKTLQHGSLMTAYLDLESGAVQYETPIHNPMCDCLQH